MRRLGWTYGLDARSRDGLEKPRTCGNSEHMQFNPALAAEDYSRLTSCTFDLNGHQAGHCFFAWDWTLFFWALDWTFVFFA